MELTDLDLFEVSLVDAGDDPLAKVTLLKRKGNSDMSDETKEDTEKQLADAALEIETLKAKVAELEAAEIEKNKPEEEMIDIDGTAVAKSAVPEVVLKRLEAIQKEKEDLEKAAAKTALEKRAAELFTFTKGTPEQKGRLLKAIEDDAELMEILQAAEALFASMSKEIGNVDVNSELVDADAKIEKLVKNYQTEKKSTYHQAYAAVIKTAEGKALLKETRSK
jgi:hypothetical protein